LQPSHRIWCYLCQKLFREGGLWVFTIWYVKQLLSIPCSSFQLYGTVSDPSICSLMWNLPCHVFSPSSTLWALRVDACS
jgi:hypothetical protein